VESRHDIEGGAEPCLAGWCPSSVQYCISNDFLLCKHEILSLAEPADHRFPNMQHVDCIQDLLASRLLGKHVFTAAIKPQVCDLEREVC
jgi:hypothetical protein